MKDRKIIASVLTLTMLLPLASCGLFESRIDSDDGPDFYDTVTKHIPKDGVMTTADALSDTDAVTEIVKDIPDKDKLSDFGDDLEFYEFADGTCVLAYNDQEAWIFDYQLSEVIPIVDLEAMLGVADPTGRGSEYFDDVKMEYEFKPNSDIELRITYNVTASHDESCKYSVYAFYPLYDVDRFGSGAVRGQLRGYYQQSVSYPGSDEPITVTNIDDIDKLYMGDFLPPVVKTVHGFITNDIPLLAEGLYTDEEVVSVWEGTVISDYTISRSMPMTTACEELTMEVTIEKSTVERYPEGRYRINIYEGLGENCTIERLDKTIETPSFVEEYADVIKWLEPWVRTYGGGMDMELMNPENDSFAHIMMDYFCYILYNSDSNEVMCGNLYREYADKYLDMRDFDNFYTDYGKEPVDCGQHGVATRLFEISGVTYKDGEYTVTVNFFAEPFRAVIACTRVFTLTDNSDGTFCITNCECTYDSGLRIEGWAT